MGLFSLQRKDRENDLEVPLTLRDAEKICFFKVHRDTLATSKVTHVKWHTNSPCIIHLFST
jgi:hypothetical protein